MIILDRLNPNAWFLVRISQFEVQYPTLKTRVDRSALSLGIPRGQEERGEKYLPGGLPIPTLRPLPLNGRGSPSLWQRAPGAIRLLTWHI